ncbi:O-antigen polysaccharide polymerase Wzy family protein [Parabacteroides sp. W1-Q-101]|uniref:O-antigen polysaccharide polymerase Wzy n=1 Tax=Parabacteroides caeci TaxID=2949650 RepID=UPI002030AB44|nr:O-antigen polysaccharide polymerase Wzy [Parabacteroides sp. W1-Q-101]MCM0722047.1 O-antigen polysaccharide polymerase Wzy family protein [Parabacteroides sp. W1-Q-101]
MTKYLHFFTFSLFSIYFVLIIYLINNGNHTDFDFSVYYVVLSILSLGIIWQNNKNKLSLFLLFILTFNLFIGARFYIYLFDSTLNPFEPTFFFDYNISYIRKISLMEYVYSYMYFITFSNYIFCRIKLRCPLGNNIKGLSTYEISTLNKILFPILCISLLYIATTETLYSLKNGYAFVETTVTDNQYSVSIINKFAPMLLIIMIGLVFVYVPQYTKKYLILYFIYAICVIIGGARATFGSVLLICIWLYSLRHKISLIKVFLTGTIGLCTLLLLFSISSRGAGLDNFKLKDGLVVFGYTQGISLMVFDACRLLDNYPLIARMQNFIPGLAFTVAKFTELFPQDATMQGYLCYYLNANLYANGLGLGWTTLSDLYVYSKGNIIVFSILSFLLGCIITTLEVWAMKSKFSLFLLITLAPGLLMISRGPLAMLFIQPYYSIGFVVLSIFLFKALKIFIHNHN